MSLGTVSELLSETLSSRSFFNKQSVIGDTVTGVITDSEVRQSRDFDDNSLETWDDGSPVQQLVINIQTDLNEPTEEYPEDDGMRTVYIRWYGAQRKALLKAAKDAGVTDLFAGDQFTASFTGLGEQKDKKKNPPKLYAFGIKPAGAIGKASR